MTRRDELSCRDFVEVIMAWLDGELEASTRTSSTHTSPCVPTA